MKKTTTILCLGIALCMLGCSDDDDQVTTTSTVPFSLTASLSPRSSDAEDTGILQGNWDANSQLGRQQPTGRNKNRFQRRSQKHSHKKNRLF